MTMPTPEAPEPAHDEFGRQISEQRIIAYLLDRVEQYVDDGLFVFVGDVIDGIARGDHHDAWNRGECDDLKERVRSIMKRHAGVLKRSSYLP